MKRFINWLVELIDWSENWPFIVTGAIGIVSAIFTVIMLFNITDTVPATFADYEPLEKQAIAIQENPDLLLKADCSITVRGGTITVTLSNSECSVITEYDQSFNVISTTKKDVATSWWLTLLMALIAGATIGFVIFIALLLLLAGIMILWEKITPLFYKSQKK